MKCISLEAVGLSLKSVVVLCCCVVVLCDSVVVCCPSLKRWTTHNNTIIQLQVLSDYKLSYAYC